MTKHRITAQDGLNVRTMRTTAGNAPIGLLPYGSIVDVIETVGEWRTIGPVQVSGVTLASPVRAYCFAAHTEPVVEPPPPPVQRLAPFGVNIQGDISAAYDAYAAGCRHFLMRGQAAAQSSATAATHPPQAGARARASFAMSDGDLSLRDWIVEHFDDGDLAVLAANAGMERPVPAKLAEMVTALVMAARRNGNLERLEREALEMRPDVEAPDASRH